MVGEDGLPVEEPAAEEEQNVTEQSSGVIQFRRRTIEGTGLHNEGREEIEREEQQRMPGRQQVDGEQRHSTPHLPSQEEWMQAQGDVGFRRNRWDHEAMGSSRRSPTDEYHGDVRPRTYRRMQGGGDRPVAQDPRGNWNRAVGYNPDFQRGLPREERSGRPLVKPERFDGTEDWNTYLQHFEWCAELNRWSEAEKAKFLTVSVTGTARQVLAGVERERLRDYNTVVQTLRARFDPMGRMELHRIQLKNQVRQAGETLSALADDIRRLVDKVFGEIPTGARNKIAKDSFIDALTDSEMRTRILQMRTQTIQEAMELAIELEALTTAEKERGQRRVREMGGTKMVADAAEVKALREELERVKRQLAQTALNGGAGDPRSRRSRVCFNCGEPSHFIRDCPKPKRQFTKDEPKGN